MTDKIDELLDDIEVRLDDAISQPNKQLRNKVGVGTHQVMEKAKTDIDINGTPEQRDRLKALVQRLLKDIFNITPEWL